MDDVFILLLIAIISLAIGIVFGGLFASSRQARRKEGESEADRASAPGETTWIYRDPQLGTTVVQVGEKKYRGPKDLDAEAKAFLEQQLTGILGWVKPVEPPKAILPDASTSPVVTPPAHEPAADPTSRERTSKQSYNPLDVFARSLRSDVSKHAAPSASIAAQIDEILQEKLNELPEEKRAIRLMELPGKGMVVMVGLDHFDGVDAVPDPEVRALIRECVAEWELRTSRQD